jgi:peptidoglycan/xylan/chitin deacetylase (PgdA/CDA1 family)
VPPGWKPTPLARASLWLHGIGVPLLGGLLLEPGLPWWPWLVGTLAANHAVLAVGMHPLSQLAGRTLVHLPGPTSQVALTFDDGPDPDVTPRVLDLLDDAGAQASFFCIGERAAAHPALVREIARRGHRVENHTWSHPNAFAAMTPLSIRREVRLAQMALTSLAGTPPRWMRAPLGLRSPLLDPVLAGEALLHASWTRRAHDGLCRDPARAAARLTRRLAGGEVLRAVRAQGLRAVALPAPEDCAASPAPAGAPAPAAAAATLA